MYSFKNFLTEAKDSQLIYSYRVAGKSATMTKMKDGDDVGGVTKIGTFDSPAEAKEACKAHFDKAVKMAKAAGRPEPKLMWA